MIGDAVVWLWVALELIAYLWPFLVDVLTVAFLWRIARRRRTWV